MMAEPRPVFRANLLASLAYLFGCLTGIAVLVIERHDRYVRFHALQSIVCSIGVALAALIVGSVPLVGRPLVVLLGLAAFVVWAVLIFKAFTGQRYKMPYLGEFVDRQIR